MANILEFESKLMSVLRERGHIEHVMMNDILDEVKMECIKSLLEFPVKIELNDEGMFFTQDDGDVIECPEYSINISDDARWLSSKIPPATFDIEQGGNLRKGEEAEAAYCCCICSLVLKDIEFKREIENVLHNYDFKSFSSNDKGITFKELLTSWQDLQSVSINICVSAAKYNIANLKKDTEKYLRDGIPDDLEIELRNLEARIKDINRSYSTGRLSPINVKGLNKIEILSLLEEKNVEIQNLQSSSPAGTLFKILNLSSEYISPIKKKRLSKLASDTIEEFYLNNESSSSIIGEQKNVTDRWRRRFFKMEKTSVRKIQVHKYLNNRDIYKLPVKQ